LGVEAIDKLDERFSKAMVVVARLGISVRQPRMNGR
jgi:RNA polymerase primary sigma factor